MIDTKDLMIGNWIEIPNKEVREIVAIFPEQKVGYYNTYKSGKMTVSTLEKVYDTDVNPISVTPELLERIGFERDKELIAMRSQVMAYHYRTDNYRLDVDNIFSNFLGNRNWHVHVDNADAETIGSGCFQYLHELQNLVRVITGYDLHVTKDMLYED